MQCTGNSGCFRKESEQPALRPTLLRQMDMGSLTCAHILDACRTHDGGSGTTNTSAQELTRRDRQKCRSLCPARGSEPRVFGFEFRLSNHWRLCPWQDGAVYIICCVRAVEDPVPKDVERHWDVNLILFIVEDGSLKSLQNNATLILRMLDNGYLPIAASPQ